jgi:phosphoglycolate phosphatase-like HAD superfamily hydrolase
MAKDFDKGLQKWVKGHRVVFWDFDGVIKDSVDVKTRAFEELFLPFGDEVVARVSQHHKENGGISRFIKIPLYLHWAGEISSKVQIEEFCERFSTSVLKGVINSPWVGGVKEYLMKYHEQQYFVLTTATPQNEIENILHILEISHCFHEVYGAPINKADAIVNVIRRMEIKHNQALMIGDSISDYEAASSSEIPFLLRRTSLNQTLQRYSLCPMFNSFDD